MSKSFICPVCEKVGLAEAMVEVEGVGLVHQECNADFGKSSNELDDLKGLEGLTAEEIEALQEAAIAEATTPSPEGSDAKDKDTKPGKAPAAKKIP